MEILLSLVRILERLASLCYYFVIGEGRVLEMLQSLGLLEYEEVFKGQDLSLTDIAELDHEALKSIGIRSVKHRTAIIKYTSGKYKIKIIQCISLLPNYFSQQHSVREVTAWKMGEASDSDQHGTQCRSGGILSRSV